MIALENLSLAVVTDLYNSFGINVVKKFRDKPTAVARLQKMLVEQNHEVFQAEGEYDVRPVEIEKTPTNDPHAASNALIATALANDPELKALVTATKEPAGKVRGRKSPHLGKKITIIREKNPKMPSSRAHARYEIYRSVKTSDEYVAKCLELGLGSRREILGDLAYDSKQHSIKLS